VVYCFTPESSNVALTGLVTNKPCRPVIVAGAGVAAGRRYDDDVGAGSVNIVRIPNISRLVFSLSVRTFRFLIFRFFYRDFSNLLKLLFTTEKVVLPRQLG